jgi:hypothetical protein
MIDTTIKYDKVLEMDKHDYIKVLISPEADLGPDTYCNYFGTDPSSRLLYTNTTWVSNDKTHYTKMRFVCDTTLTSGDFLLSKTASVILYSMDRILKSELDDSYVTINGKGYTCEFSDSLFTNAITLRGLKKLGISLNWKGDQECSFSNMIHKPM